MARSEREAAHLALDSAEIASVAVGHDALLEYLVENYIMNMSDVTVPQEHFTQPHPSYKPDGGKTFHAEQASGPMMNPVEMGMSGPVAVLAYIRSRPDYIRQFRAAYVLRLGSVSTCRASRGATSGNSLKKRSDRAAKCCRAIATAQG